jgi:PAS domain S-box-containing protein
VINETFPNTPTVLIIDDTPVNLGIIAESLESRGLRLVVAQDGMEGLQRAAFVKPDLILLDVMMPGIDGFEVCRRLKTNDDTADIPVIFMTALAETEHKITGFQVGGVDYITKPMQIDEVIARVGTHLKLKAMQQQLQQQNAQLQEQQAMLELRVKHRTAELSVSNRLLLEEIEERKRIEEELALREREFRTLAENSPDAIVRYDRNCRRIYFNRAYAEAVGLATDQALGKTPQECWWIVSPSAEEYTARLLRVMDAAETDELQMEMRDKEGNPVYRIMSLIPEFDDNNQVVSVLSISHDITGIKRMETMLRRSELEFRSLAENSPQMIVRYDRDCRRIYINPAYEHQTGIALETAWHKTPYEVWKPLMPCEEFVVRLKRVMETGLADRVLFEWHDRDGSLVTHDMHVVAEYDEERHVIGALVLGHNITELKATERRLEESRRQLRILAAKREEAREEERKRIAREIHDELGQLLNVLRLNVATLDLRFGDDNADLRDKANKMIGTIDHAILMVRNLASRLRPAVLSAGIVYALEWLLQEYRESTGIICQLHLPEEEISLDEDRSMGVFRIVQESLTNVLRHSGANRVDITLQKLANSCEVKIQDNGKGFDAGKIDRPNAFGIVGMRERALILNGTLEIENVKTGGTLLKLCIPIT